MGSCLGCGSSLCVSNHGLSFFYGTSCVLVNPVFTYRIVTLWLGCVGLLELNLEIPRDEARAVPI